MPNEFSNASYQLAAAQREANGDKKPSGKPDDGNRSKIVIEPMPEAPAKGRPAQVPWKLGRPGVNDENSYDRNTITPEQMNELVQKNKTSGNAKSGMTEI